MPTFGTMMRTLFVQVTLLVALIGQTAPTYVITGQSPQTLKREPEEGSSSVRALAPKTRLDVRWIDVTQDEVWIRARIDRLEGWLTDEDLDSGSLIAIGNYERDIREQRRNAGLRLPPSSSAPASRVVIIPSTGLDADQIQTLIYVGAIVLIGLFMIVFIWRVLRRI